MNDTITRIPGLLVGHDTNREARIGGFAFGLDKVVASDPVGDPNLVGIFAAEVMAQAILRAVAT